MELDLVWGENMKSHYFGLDVLRGIGIFFVLVLHTAFYYYADIYSVDLANPSPLITFIGLLLMFAGLFAMISGVSHTLQYLKNIQTEEPKTRTRYMVISGVLLLVIAYAYFLFTGPGIIHFDTQSMDESLLVSLLHQGNFSGWSLDRILYVDNLVMLGTNVILLALFFRIVKRNLLHPRMPVYLLLGATLFMALSYVRIPLYNVYLSALDEGNMGIVLLLNFFVNKNNPILPFFGFALFGAWLALLLHRGDFRKVVKTVIPVALGYLAVGVTGYILAPETMLERAIDPTWYFIMITQIGVFLLMILLAIKVFDHSKKGCRNPITRFLSRYGVAGLTPFFLESVVSAVIFFLLNLITPLHLSIPGALLYGLCLALLWGFFLMAWQKIDYRYGLEWMHSHLVSRWGSSSKKAKLAGKTDV
jgi:hypothetical protein